jgi:fusion and transport protein UGO1
MVPTMLHSLISPAFAHSTPLLLRSRLGIDPVVTPGTYSVAKFVSRTLELFLKLPFETVLRRAQVAVLVSPEYLIEGKKMETVVDIGPYNGPFGTMWSISREEGVREEPVPAKGAKKGKKAQKKGQGLEGLWRGWKVGFYGLAGLWATNALGSSGNSAGEF